MSEPALALAKVIGDLNACWQPHPAQQRILNAVFLRLLHVVMVECGRKFGKTETIAYFLWRGAMLFGGGWYYFAPEQKQAKEIIWASQRIQTFGPQSYLAAVNNTEMRLSFINGGFIKIDGSDNFNAYRGITPRGAAYDEFRDFRPEFHKAFGPNLAVHNAPLLLCGTPPEALELDHYDAMKSDLQLGRDLFNFPTWMNPHISRDWLRREKAKLYSRGEGDVWEREFEAKRVIGGSNAIFPMFSRAKHVRPHAEILAEIARDRKKLVWQVGADPGTTTRFGVLFRAVNPYTRKVYVLDEIYEGDALENSTSRMMPRINMMREELYPGWSAFGMDWEMIYDEAAAWFASESLASFDEAWTPTAKATKPKESGLSLMKDQMLYGLLVVSDRCKNLVKEIEGYIKDKDGKIPKVNDHLLDVSRYLDAFSACDLVPVEEPKAPDPDTQRRFYKPEDDLQDEADEFELDF
jgi:hypothetical protein